MSDRYDIFIRAYQKRLMRNMSTPAIDRVVDLMNDVLNEREEIQMRFRSSITDLREAVIKQAEYDDWDDGQILVKVLELMFDEMMELHIDDCFAKTFEPPKPEKKAKDSNEATDEDNKGGDCDRRYPPLAGL